MLLKEFFIDVDIETFYNVFWLNSQWYKDFLTNQLKDIEIQISDWEKASSESTTTSNHPNDSFPVSLKRRVRSKHPSKMAFPGLPSHAEVSVLHGYIFSYKNSHNYRLSEEPNVTTFATCLTESINV